MGRVNPVPSGTYYGKIDTDLGPDMPYAGSKGSAGTS